MRGGRSGEGRRAAGAACCWGCDAAGAGARWTKGAAADRGFLADHVVRADDEWMCCRGEEGAWVDQVVLAEGDGVGAADVGAGIEVG